MNNALSQFTVFSKENFGSVRTLFRPEDGSTWFVLADVCRILGISNPSDAASRLQEDERYNYTLANTEGIKRKGPQSYTLLSESGLYALIFKSRKPEARTFRKWVTAEVLPSIRKNGAYILGQENIDQKEYARLKSRVATLCADVAGLAKKNRELQQQYDELVADYRNSFFDSIGVNTDEMVTTGDGFVCSPETWKLLNEVYDN